jgi:RNA polymerase sigma-70 factor, ECF subfamily
MQAVALPIAARRSTARWRVLIDVARRTNIPSFHAGAGDGGRAGVTNDAEVLADLVRDHSAAIYRVALSIVRDAALAEDVTQDTLIKAWQALPTFRGDSSMKSWVLRIAHNTAISTLRRRRDVLKDPVELPERSTHDTVEDRVQGRAALRDFEAALDSLDELSRSIVVMREIEHLSYDEIAEALGVGLPTVKTRLLRARRSLANALGEWKP